MATSKKAVEASGANLNKMTDDDTALDEMGDEESGDSAGGVEVSSRVDDAPIVRYVQKLLLDAINGGASDIHLETV